MEWEIAGPPEIREVDPRAFFSTCKVLPQVGSIRMSEPLLEIQPQYPTALAIDDVDAHGAPLIRQQPTDSSRFVKRNPSFARALVPS